MKYQLIAIDLDGTIINQDGDIIPSAQKAIQQAINKGMKITLATGRMYQPSNCFARELGITIPLICYQGALIREPDNRNVLWHQPLSTTIARKVIKEVRQMGTHQYVFVDDEMYVEEIIERDLWYAQRNGVELHLVEDLFAFLKKPPTEIAARGEPAEIEHLVGHLNASFSSSLLVTKVHSSFCEIAHPASGKGNALKYLARLLGIKQSQTVAIGDSANDISMLQWAGLGIVVGSAPAEVNAVADWIIDTDTEDSFAQAMERLLHI